MTSEDLKKCARDVFRILKKEYPDARVLLEFSNPFELLIATILAAQCTDERVNQVTGTLFKKYPRPEAFARAPIERLEADIKPTGFFRNKAKSIKAASALLVEKYNGQVPSRMEELTNLPGVGRKTAGVLLGACFGQSAIIVDTHVLRVTGRIGLTKETHPEKVEKDLAALLPPVNWTQFSNVVGFHGRRICVARSPKCPICKVSRLCDHGRKVLRLK